MNTTTELKDLRQAKDDRRKQERRRAVQHYTDQARIAELEQCVSLLITACERQLHNDAIWNGMTGKAWDGNFVHRTMQEAVNECKYRILDATDPRV